MAHIHRLDPVVANQIAAGEVVERPASAVKELVENSLDAEASRIIVRVDGEGRSLTVMDDGIGILEDELALAVDRHTTSKIYRIEDLESQRSLGFRGEALAAIASVSRFTIQSRPRGTPAGNLLEVDYGRLGALRKVAMSEGTRVTVEDLFHQHPARLKGLKTPAAEFGAIQHTVQQLAVARPDVRMTLNRDDRRVLETPGLGDAAGTLLAVFGRELAASLIGLDYVSESGLRIHGYVAPAHVHRANRFGEGLFVNGRWINNWGLRAAVEEAFRPNLPDRRFPYFWLWLEMPPADYDPNAHPTKAEVRLYQENRIKALLFRQVQEALARRSTPVSWDAEDRSADIPRAQEAGLDLRWDGKEGVTISEDERGRVLHRQFQELTPLGQWRAKYILAQGVDGLYLIDQHAAHERVYFERFRREGAHVTFSQPLLVPIPESLSAGEWAAWQRHRSDLDRLGFEVEELGGHTVAVRAVPTAFHDLDTHQGLFRVVMEMLSEDESAQGRLHPVSWAEEAAYAMAACKAAIKANRPMSHDEMRWLLAQMSQVEDPRGCPHGRPTLIVLSLEEVDRRFGRRG